MNSPLSNISNDKLYKFNENPSIEKNEDKYNLNKLNNLSMIEYTKQILEKDNSSSIHKSEINNLNAREYPEYQKIDSKYNDYTRRDNEYFLNKSEKEYFIENDSKINNHVSNTKPMNIANKTASSSEYAMRINFLENCLKDKENIFIDLKQELNNLHLDKQNLTIKLSEEKKRNFELEYDLTKYRNIMRENEELKFKFLKLTDDYNVMCNKYNRSEHIRYQQSNIIHSLQKEIDMIRNRQIQDAIYNNMHVLNKFESADNDKPNKPNKNPKKVKKKNKKTNDSTIKSKSSDKNKVIKRSKSKKRA